MLLLGLVVSFSSASPVFAVENSTPPAFPSCLNPQGTLRVSYDSGIHGVPGQSMTLAGSDRVYNITEDQNLQCFCATSGEGVSTSWWKTGQVSESDIEYLKSLGWVFVPDGSIWGLDPEIYFAKNNNYSCATGIGGGGDGGSNNNNSSNNQSSNSSGTGGTTLRGQVLGLATTGTLPQIVSYLTFGLSGLWLTTRFGRSHG